MSVLKLLSLSSKPSHLHSALWCYSWDTKYMFLFSAAKFCHRDETRRQVQGEGTCGCSLFYQRCPSSSWLFQEQLVPVSNLLLTPRTSLLGTSLVYQHQLSCRLWVPASLNAFSKLLDPNGLNFFTLFPTLRMVIAACVYYLYAILVSPISLFQLSHTCSTNSLCSGIC